MERMRGLLVTKLKVSSEIKGRRFRMQALAIELERSRWILEKCQRIYLQYLVPQWKVIAK
jgi:hypothetical protein